MDCCADAASPQVWRQFRLMMWRNFLIKRRKFGELIKGWILPVLVFLVIYLLYLEFPEVIGTVKIVQEKVRNFEDDGLYAGIGDADDLFGGGDDDFLFNKIQREVIDISLNSYLEQVVCLCKVLGAHASSFPLPHTLNTLHCTPPGFYAWSFFACICHLL
jgi:hypothetical protein